MVSVSIPADLERELGQRLRGARPLKLGDRALRTGNPQLHRRRQRAHRPQPQALGADLQAGDLVANERVVRMAALARQLDQLVERAREPDRRRGADARTLVHQRRDRDHPTVALTADDVLVGHVGVLDEELVELRLAGDLAQRPDLDLLLLHVHEEVGEALVLGRVGVGAGDEHAPLGLVGEGRPHLLPGDPPAPVLLRSPSSSARPGRSPTPARRSPGTRSPRPRGSAPGSAPSAPRSRARSPPVRPSPGRARSPAAAPSPAPAPRRRSPARSGSRPRPPYSFGHETPAQPSPCSLPLPLAFELELHLVAPLGCGAGMVLR